jgi:hypothetical protein
MVPASDHPSIGERWVYYVSVAWAIAGILGALHYGIVG